MVRAPVAGNSNEGNSSKSITIAEPSTCERAAVATEQASGLPPGLLQAIGRVESGRWDNARGRVTAWPWTINAAGKGLWFDTKDAAARSVKDLLNGGTRSIDVGCFQINLFWHPTAFASLEQAFDPDANAAYAAHFLLALFSQIGSWDAAVEAYHSADPTLGFAYRQQVFSSWAAAAPIRGLPAARNRTTPTLAGASRPIAVPLVVAGVQIWTPMPFGTAAGVVAMPGSPAPEQPRPVAGATQTLPMVLYQAVPPALRRGPGTLIHSRSGGVASAEVTAPR
jgi:transglycosylase-like protein with SLT domain